MRVHRKAARHCLFCAVLRLVQRVLFHVIHGMTRLLEWEQHQEECSLRRVERELPPVRRPRSRCDLRRRRHLYSPPGRHPDVRDLIPGVEESDIEQVEQRLAELFDHLPFRSD